MLVECRLPHSRHGGCVLLIVSRPICLLSCVSDRSSLLQPLEAQYQWLAHHLASRRFLTPCLCALFVRRIHCLQFCQSRHLYRVVGEGVAGMERIERESHSATALTESVALTACQVVSQCMPAPLERTLDDAHSPAVILSQTWSTRLLSNCWLEQ